MEYAMNQPVMGRRGRGMFDKVSTGERRGRRGARVMFNESSASAGRGSRHGGGRGHGRQRGFDLGPMMGPGFGSRGRRRRRGDVRLAALLLIAEAPRNGYQIIQELAERTDGRWKPSSGAIYPALSLLEDEGLIRAAEGETGKVYELTEAGRIEATAAQERPAPWEQVGGSGDDPTRALAHSLRQVSQAVQVIAQSDDATLAAQVTEELDALKRRLFQLLADAQN